MTAAAPPRPPPPLQGLQPDPRTAPFLGEQAWGHLALTHHLQDLSAILLTGTQLSREPLSRLSPRLLGWVGMATAPAAGAWPGTRCQCGRKHAPPRKAAWRHRLGEGRLKIKSGQVRLKVGESPPFLCSGRGGPVSPLPWEGQCRGGSMAELTSPEP